MQKPNVIILSAFLFPFRSGAEVCVEKVAARFADRFDITIVTAKMRRDLPRVGEIPSLLVGGLGRGGQTITVIRVGLGYSFDKWFYPFLAPFVVRRLRPDIVHAVLETFAGAALLLCRWVYPQARRILTLQTTNRSFLKCPIIRSAHRVMAISSVLVEAAKRCGRDAKLIPNGIDYWAIREACARYPKAPGRILFVGRLEKMKGVDTLLTAFSEVVGKFPQAYLRIVGDGSMHSQLSAHSSQLVSHDHIHFLGYLSDSSLWREYAEAEIFCALSLSEAMGNVFLEAQAAGCAVIGTRVGGVPEIVLHGKTGILIPSDDPEAATTTLALLLKDQELRGKLSSAAVEHARQYDWSGIAEKYAGIYEALVLPSCALGRERRQ